MKAPRNLTREEAAHIVQALGGQARVMQGMNISRTTMRRLLECGAGGANAAALRLAYAHKLEGYDWMAIATTSFAPTELSAAAA